MNGYDHDASAGGQAGGSRSHSRVLHGTPLQVDLYLADPPMVAWNGQVHHSRFSQGTLNADRAVVVAFRVRLPGLVGRPEHILQRLHKREDQLLGATFTIFPGSFCLGLAGIHVDARVPLVIAPRSENRDYLQTKKTRAGHVL
jgi:hypothetical protein